MIFLRIKLNYAEFTLNAIYIFNDKKMIEFFIQNFEQCTLIFQLLVTA